MIPGLLVKCAVALRSFSSVVEDLKIPIRSDKRYLSTTVTSQLILTPEELELWDRSIDEEERVAIFRRGLLRYKIALKDGRLHERAQQ